MTDDHQRIGNHSSPELKVRYKTDSSLEDGPDFLFLYGSFSDCQGSSRIFELGGLLLENL